MTVTAPPQLEVGERLRKARLKKGLTLEHVAREAGCSYSIVVRTEGGRGPQVRARPAVQRIARVLGVDL